MPAKLASPHRPDKPGRAVRRAAPDCGFRRLALGGLLLALALGWLAMLPTLLGRSGLTPARDGCNSGYRDPVSGRGLRSRICRSGPMSRVRGSFRLAGPLERLAARVLRHAAPLALVVVPLALGLGSLAGYAFGQSGIRSSAYQAARLQAVVSALAGIDGDYILAAGDSHIERWPARRLCGLPLVNAGVSGATADSFGAFLDAIALPRPPRAVILTIGTNDANGKRFRDADEAESRFRTGFKPLLTRLTRAAKLVVVTGVPAIASPRAEGFSSAAAARIDAAAEDGCGGTPGCIVMDPFAGLVPGPDGVHLADYAGAYGMLGPALCTVLAGATVTAHRD